MATTTTNFSWPIPQSSDLVKDGATAIASLGSGIDTSMAELKGGTTGQILSKSSNTDMDFTWTTPNPGDITGVTAGTGITGGGTSGDVTVSFDVANYGGGQYAAGKNKIINGDFGIWQRGTSFNTSGVYTADRWLTEYTGGTVTYSQQAFTSGTAPVSGYESQYYMRINKSVSGAGYFNIQQRIEDVRTLAGQNITISFWAKADATVTNEPYTMQNFGSGGSTSVYTALSTQTLTTSWARYSIQVTVPSISGKTIGANSYFLVYPIRVTDSTTHVIDLWGVQVEAGSTATPFQTATGTKQGELAACQRYLPVIGGQYDSLLGFAYSTTGSQFTITFPVTPRVAPTGISLVGTVSDWRVGNSGFTNGTPTAISWNAGGTRSVTINATTTAGSPTIAQNQPVYLQAQSNSGFILFTGCEL